MRVLFVDDDSAIREQTKIFLERENDRLAVETASSADKALGLLEENNYDAIVSDYQMPGTDGLEFLEIVREERNSDIPFIIFTGKGREEVAMEALNLGADRYLQKGGNPKSQYGVLAQATVQEFDYYETKKAFEKSEDRYRRLFETAQDGMLILDAKTGEVKDANPYIQDLTGYSKEELVGRELWEIGTFRNIVENKEKFEELVEEGYIRYEDLPLDMKGEGEASVEFVSNTYEAGEEEVVQCNIRDISERKKREGELRRERRRFQEIFDNANDAMYLHELTEEGLPGEFIEVNDTACEMLGYSREKFLEMTPQEIDSSERADEVSEVMNKLAEERDVRFEMIHQAKDGTEIPVEIHSHLFELEGEKRVLSIARDISGREEMEENLRMYKMAVEGSEDLIAAVDEEYRYLFANSSYAEYHGVDREEIIGKEVDEVLGSEPFEDEIKPEIDRCLEGKSVQYEMNRKHEQTNPHVFEISYYPLQNDGEILGVVAVMRDKTQLEKRKRELLGKIEGLEEFGHLIESS